MPKGKERIENVCVTKEMEDSYLAYSLAVIVGRALPDIYDGLKPVHRRILTAMKDLNLRSDGPFRKAARVEGDTMGKYHPHGAAYGSMVTLAAPYANNHVLIDGHGNWGSPTDGAAASRYTECRLSSFSEEVLLDQFGLCETKPNYDGSLQEPVRLEAQLPNVLILGSEGIGVGYATSVPQHNLRGVVKAAKALLSGKSPNSTDLIPDFPSGCDIIKDDSLKEYLTTGRGSILMRAKVKTSVFKRDGRKADWHQLVFTNLPYQANTEQVGEEIRKGLEKGVITGVTEIRDESDLSGERLVVYCKENPDLVVSQLYHNTRLEKTFGANNTVIHNLVPKQYAPHEIIWHWLQWRDERLLVQFAAEKDSLEGRVHILEGLLFALSKIDKVIALIRKSADKAEARAKLMGRGFNLSQQQADAILNMRLHQLCSMDASALEEEMNQLNERLNEVNTLLSDKSLRDKYLSEQLDYLQKRHGNARKCALIDRPKTVDVPVAKGNKKPAVAAAPRSRYMKVDTKKGIIDQLKGPRGSNVVIPDNDKLIILSEDGVVKRLPSRHSGPAFDNPVGVCYYQRQSVIEKEVFLAVWIRNGAIYSNVIQGEHLCKTTSKGKRWLPQDSTLLYFGKGSYEINFVSKRRKPRKLTIKGTKQRALGGVGNKLFPIDEVVIDK